MVWPPALKHSIREGDGEDRVVVNSKNLLICDKDLEKANLIHCGKPIKRDLLIELNCFFQDTKIGKRIVDKPYQLLSEPLS